MSKMTATGGLLCLAFMLYSFCGHKKGRRLVEQPLSPFTQFRQRDKHEGLGTPKLEQAVDVGAVLVRHGGNVETIDLDSGLDRLVFVLPGHGSGTSHSTGVPELRVRLVFGRYHNHSRCKKTPKQRSERARNSKSLVH